MPAAFAAPTPAFSLCVRLCRESLGRASVLACMAPPGARVWLGGLNTCDTPSSVRVACLYSDNRKPAAHCGTFSLGCLVFQVFCCEQEDATLSPDNEVWLAAKGLYVPALIPIAPAVASVLWPPDAVFAVADLKPLAERLSQGLPLRP